MDLIWKPLERRSRNIGAQTPFGNYYVENFGKSGPFWVEFRNAGFGGREEFPTQAEAIAFAESDFANRRAALASPPSPAEVTVTAEMMGAIIPYLGPAVSLDEVRAALAAALQLDKKG